MKVVKVEEATDLELLLLSRRYPIFSLAEDYDLENGQCELDSDKRQKFIDLLLLNDVKTFDIDNRASDYKEDLNLIRTLRIDAPVELKQLEEVKESESEVVESEVVESEVVESEVVESEVVESEILNSEDSSELTLIDTEMLQMKEEPVTKEVKRGRKTKK